MPPRARRSARIPSLLLAAVLATVAGIQLAVPSGSTAASVAPVRTGGESVVQIVSHPDDDLFFMNPDLGQSLRTGHSLASVFLTAGEADGVNAPRGRKYRGIPLPAADKARYAEARQNGIRAAYAEMATGDRTSGWQRSAIRTDGGGWAELDTLKARPEVNLVWLQLHEAGSSAANRPYSLHGLWDRRVPRLASELSSGTPVAENYTYSKQQVEQTITGVLKRFEPTFVRMLDPTNGRIPNPRLYPDHQDHMYGARFVQRALARYGETAGHPHFTVQNYLGYLNGRLPHVLDPAALREKLRILKTYAWSEYPSNYCEAEAGCGDRKVAARPAGHGWAPGIRYSRNTSTSWLQNGPGGELWAFSVLDTRVAVWHRPPGARGRWSGPKLLPGTGMDSGVVSQKLPDGRIALFTTRTSFEGPAGYRRDVVTTAQRRPGGAFAPWRSLGLPKPPGASGPLDISEPAVAVDHTGRATVYLRDGGHALSARAQRPDGGWEPWRGIGGRTVYGDPVVATDRAGRQYVFAQTLTSSLAWTQDAPGAPLRGPVATGLPASTLPMTARADGDGVQLFFRRPGSGSVLAARFTGGSATAPLTDLGGRAGFGPVSATGTSGPGAGSKGMRGTGARPTGTLLAARDGSGRLGTAVLSGDAAGRPRWSRGGFLFAGAPAATTDAAGASCVAAVGLDGRLYWSSRGAGGGEAAAWRPVGRAPVAAGSAATTH